MEKKEGERGKKEGEDLGNCVNSWGVEDDRKDRKNKEGKENLEQKLERVRCNETHQTQELPPPFPSQQHSPFLPQKSIFHYGDWSHH